MPDLERRFTIRANDFVNAGEVSLEIQSILKHIGFNSSLIRRISVCAYESEMNVVMHGGDGQLSVEIDSDTLVMEICDNGPGIADIEKAMQAGFSTASDEHREMGFGAGMGLPNMKKNSNEITFTSDQGRGNRVKMRFHLS